MKGKPSKMDKIDRTLRQILSTACPDCSDKDVMNFYVATIKTELRKLALRAMPEVRGGWIDLKDNKVVFDPKAKPKFRHSDYMEGYRHAIADSEENLKGLFDV